MYAEADGYHQQISKCLAPHALHTHIDLQVQLIA